MNFLREELNAVICAVEAAIKRHTKAQHLAYQDGLMDLHIKHRHEALNLTNALVLLKKEASK